jgi:hypothetical protein
MPELSVENIDLISNDIKKQGIVFSHLADDLTDHVCCDVENEMTKGLSFNEAYSKVKQKIGFRRFTEIQEETLYAVDSKYRKMKNTMKISGIAGTLLLGFASLFKVMHWPLAGVMMTIGSVLLAFVFMPSALGVLWKETHSSKRILLFISAFFAAMFFIMGILFKVQHWPAAAIILSLAGVSGVFFFIPSLLANSLKNPENKAIRPAFILGAVGLICYVAGFLFKMQHWPLAGFLLMTGLFILFVITFPWYTIFTWKDEKNISAEFIFIVVGSLAIILPSALVSLNLQRDYNRGYFICLDQQKALYNTVYNINRTLIGKCRDSVSYKTMEQLHARTDELLAIVNDLEKRMILESEGEPGMPVENPVTIKVGENGPDIEYQMLKYPFHPSPVHDFLLKGTASRQKLDAAIKDYLTYLSSLIPEEEYHKMNIMSQNSLCLPVMNSENRKISMISGLHALALLKNRLLISESSALKSISQHNENYQ